MSDDPVISEVIDRIEVLNRGVARFWSNCEGWAPIEAAQLLSRSRLDWQVSLSASLRMWIREPATALTEGELILAWVNLGTLVEGTIKTFLSVYYETYRQDIEGVKAANVYDRRQSRALPPDGLTLDKLKKFCASKEIFTVEDGNLVELVQVRRNAIHAFKDRPIGDGNEFQSAIRGYLRLLNNLNGRMPYPDDVYDPAMA